MTTEQMPIGKQGERFASLAYRYRWITTIVVLAAIGWMFAQGVGFVAEKTSAVVQIGDVSDGRGSIDPQLFDPSLEVWFTGEDKAIGIYREIENRFVAEDFVMVAFEVTDTPNGVFDRQSLETIARLTEEFQRIPGVRHVRSLTHNPWIRWGMIEDSERSEAGLIVSDLVEANAKLSDDEITERMIAVLGAQKAAARIGEDRVRTVLGRDADFDNYIGEPLVLGTLVNDIGTTTAIQVQVIRPLLADDILETFGDLGAKLYAIHYQRAALRAIELVLRQEAGLVVPTDAYKALTKTAQSLPNSPENDRFRRDLADMTKTFVVTPDGQTVQKYHEYAQTDAGEWSDTLDPEGALAPSDFTPHAISPYTYHLAGVPIFERNFEITGKSDAALLPLAWLIIFVGLFLLFRNFAGALIPMLVVIVSVLGTVGSIFIAARLFNNLTAMLPNLLTVIGVADAVHLVAAYLMLRPSFDDRKSLVTEVIRRNAVPVLLTSITTAAGFYSLIVVNLEPVQQFGIAMAVGSLIAYVVTMSLVPLMLSFLPIGKPEKPKKALAGLFAGDRPERLASWITRNAGTILGTTAVLTVVTLIGVSQVRIDADPRTMFPNDNSVIVDMQWIEDHLGGTGDLELVFSAKGGGAPLNQQDSERLEALRIAALGHQNGIFQQPISEAQTKELLRLEQIEQEWRQQQIGLSVEFLGQLDNFEKRLRAEMELRDSPLRFLTDLISPLDVLRKIHQVQNENRASYYRVPTEEDVHPESRQAQLSYDEYQQDWWLTPGQDASSLVAQYYLQYENGARPGENLASQLTPDRLHFRMQGRLAMGSSNERESAYARIQEIAKEEFPALAGGSSALSTMALSGKTLLVDAAGRVIAEGYTKSVALALLVIAAFIGLVFRSIRFALLSVIPNVFPILVPIAILGALGISLDGPAIVASSIALGLAVDDTIHLFSKFRDAERNGLSDEAAIAYAFRECGNAVTITTIVLVFGFLMIASGDFSPNVLIGLLGGSIIVLAYIADFVVTPAALYFFSRSAKRGAELRAAESSA